MASCIKCKSKAVVILRSKDKYCQACYQKCARHKFRSVFGRNRLFREEDLALVEVNGSAGSVCLVHLLRDGMCEELQAKRLRVRPLYVLIYSPLEEIHMDSLLALIKFLQKTGCSFCTVSLAAVFSESLESDVVYNFNGEQLNCKYDQLLKRLHKSCTSLTMVANLLETLKMSLLYRIARLIGAKAVLLFDHSTSLSSDILSKVALGRGEDTVNDAAILDERWPAVLFVRPIRDFLHIELLLYNYFSDKENIVFTVYPNRFLCDMSQSSLQGASAQFIEELQSEFPATISTLIASASKLGSRSVAMMEGEKCQLCSSTLRENNTFASDVSLCYACAQLASAVGEQDLFAKVIQILKSDIQSSCSETKDSAYFLSES